MAGKIVIMAVIREVDMAGSSLRESSMALMEVVIRINTEEGRDTGLKTEGIRMLEGMGVTNTTRARDEVVTGSREGTAEAIKAGTIMVMAGADGVFLKKQTLRSKTHANMSPDQGYVLLSMLCYSKHRERAGWTV